MVHAAEVASAPRPGDRDGLREDGSVDHLRHSAWSIDVLPLRDDRLAAVTSLLGGGHFRLFDLPEVLV